MAQISNLDIIVKYSKVHLKIKSFHPKLFEKALNKILNKVTALNLKISKSISLPTKIQRYTVLRSPHIDKKSREQFEIRHYKKLLIIYFDPLNIKNYDFLPLFRTF